MFQIGQISPRTQLSFFVRSLSGICEKDVCDLLPKFHTEDDICTFAMCLFFYCNLFLIKSPSICCRRKNYKIYHKHIAHLCTILWHRTWLWLQLFASTMVKDSYHRYHICPHMFFFGSFTFRKLYGLSREIPMFLAAIYRAWCIGLFLLATHTCVRMGEICGLVPQACYKVLVICSDGSAITENNNFCRFMQNNKVHAYVIRHHRHPLCDLWPK